MENIPDGSNHPNAIKRKKSYSTMLTWTRKVQVGLKGFGSGVQGFEFKA